MAPTFYLLLAGINPFWLLKTAALTIIFSGLKTRLIIHKLVEGSCVKCSSIIQGPNRCCALKSVLQNVSYVALFITYNQPPTHLPIMGPLYMMRHIINIIIVRQTPKTPRTSTTPQHSTHTTVKSHPQHENTTMCDRTRVWPRNIRTYARFLWHFHTAVFVVVICLYRASCICDVVRWPSENVEKFARDTRHACWFVHAVRRRRCPSKWGNGSSS